MNGGVQTVDVKRHVQCIQTDEDVMEAILQN